MKKFRKALIKSYGIMSTVAKRLNVDRSTVYDFMNKHPELKEERIRERDKIIDHAEVELFKKIAGGEWEPIKFALQHLGKSRGYVAKQQIEANIIGAELTANDFKKSYDEMKEQEEIESKESDTN